MISRQSVVKRSRGDSMSKGPVAGGNMEHGEGRNKARAIG